MNQAKNRPDISGILEQRRRELNDRPDISARMRKLSQSSTHNPAPVAPRKRSALITIVLATAAAVFLLALIVSVGVAVASGVWFNNQLNDPNQTALDFYSSLHQQNYGRAYGYFSSNAKKQLSQSDFTTQFSAYDSVGGIVESYSVEGKATVKGSTAVVTMDVVRRGNTTQAQQQTIYLTNESGSWKIDRIVLGKTIPTSGAQGS